MKDIIKDNKVCIQYKLIDHKDWVTIYLTFEEFFDYNFCKKKDVIFNKIELYTDYRDYLKIEISKILYINIFIQDKKQNLIVKKLSYWNKGESQVYEHNEYNNKSLIYKTIIFYSKIEKNELLVRLEEINGQLKPISESVIVENNAYITKFSANGESIINFHKLEIEDSQTGASISEE